MCLVAMSNARVALRFIFHLMLSKLCTISFDSILLLSLAVLLEDACSNLKQFTDNEYKLNASCF